MTHWRKMFDERFIGSWDFEGKPEGVVTIKSVQIEELQTQDGTSAKKPVLYFTKGKKGMVLNKTNARVIAELYGNDTDKWVGKSVALFATTCQAFGKTVECVRVKNQRPDGPTTEPDEDDLPYMEE